MVISTVYESQLHLVQPLVPTTSCRWGVEPNWTVNQLSTTKMASLKSSLTIFLQRLSSAVVRAPNYESTSLGSNQSLSSHHEAHPAPYPSLQDAR